MGRSSQKRAQSQKNGSENKKNDTKPRITRHCNELRPIFLHQKLDHIKRLPKSDANLTSDLLVFDFWVHFFQKIHQKPQKVIVFLVQNLDQIGQGFFDTWIARWIKFFRKVFALFDLGLLHGVNWAQSGTKNADFENVLPAVGKIWKFQKELYIP